MQQQIMCLLLVETSFLVTNSNLFNLSKLEFSLEFGPKRVPTNISKKSHMN